MPIYEYRCKTCGELTEVMLKISDSQPTKCERCGGKLERQISNTTFILKGSGWYATDYGAKDAGRKRAPLNQANNGSDGAGTGDLPGAANETKGDTGEEGSKETKKKDAVAPAK